VPCARTCRRSKRVAAIPSILARSAALPSAGGGSATGRVLGERLAITDVIGLGSSLGFLVAALARVVWQALSAGILYAGRSLNLRAMAVLVEVVGGRVFFAAFVIGAMWILRR
jgi:hypothetical protein